MSRSSLRGFNLEDLLMRRTRSGITSIKSIPPRTPSTIATVAVLFWGVGDELLGGGAAVGIRDKLVRAGVPVVIASDIVDEEEVCMAIKPGLGEK